MHFMQMLVTFHIIAAQMFHWREQNCRLPKGFNMWAPQPTLWDRMWSNDVIDSNMGKGHSNLPESKFHVLTKFRPKDINLHQVHNQFSTNLGLCQSNMTFLVEQKRPSYHWAKDLFSKMGLPEVDGLEETIIRENQERMRRLQQTM